eukprot:gene5704-7872_t
MMEEYRHPIVIQAPYDPATASVRQTEGLDLSYDLQGHTIRNRFREFFRNFKKDNLLIYTYRNALVRQWNRNEYFIEVDLADLNQFDAALTENLQSRPSEIMPYFEAGAKDALKLSLTQESEQQLAQPNIPDFQIIFKSAQLPQSLRDLTAAHVNKLIKVPGIVISCSKTRPKPVKICIKCTKCKSVKNLVSNNPMAGVAIPNKCDYKDNNPGAEDCGPGTYSISADDCEYIDQQTLKLQESPEVVPTGEMPRNILLVVDRYLVDKVTPGTRVSVVGISSIFNSSKKKVKGSQSNNIRETYLRVCGIHADLEGSGRTNSIFTPQEEEEMLRLSRDPFIYEKIARSIAPQISGDYTIDIKKSLACLLMGGSRKVLPDGMRLRGDINVLLMGDPSTAKSQFLKFIERVAPIGVYTSGKGSSAAGLTASVIKDSRGEFYLEGGAMVLADGGVICIDEFDKMRENDRVAIHEAMEQQTISIAKAGITTVLNCRASVLAAANPIFGRYDDLKAIGDNIDLMTTILSRFDCIFIVRDIRDEERDRNIARHVLGVHINSSMSDNTNTTSSSEISPAVLKKYIMFCRERCAPRLNEEASAMLSNKYVDIRNVVRQRLIDKPNGEGQVVPITTRQLEALVRLSEALAKMRLSAEATVSDVEEAVRLFKISTLAASEPNATLSANNILSSIHSNTGVEVDRVSDFLKRRLGLRMTANTKQIQEEALVLGFSIDTIRRVIKAMVMKDEILELNQGKMLKRIR